MSSQTLTDSFGRDIRYLRLSVTDRCNLRCFYCMPKEGITYVDKADLLTYEEMFRIIRVLHEAGVNKVRITGGEPFTRKDLMSLLRRISELPRLNWHMTTNAVLVGPYISELAKLGISSVNVSLDAMDRSVFREITRRDVFEEVYENLLQLVRSGIKVKVNCVAMRNRNEEQILPLAGLAREYPVDVRFIEEMPFNGTSEVRPILDHHEIKSILKSQYADLQPAKGQGETAEIFTSTLLKGRLGVIPAFTRTFCGTCDRLRISATGDLRTCLYGTDELNLVTLIRQGADDSELLEAIRQSVLRKAPDGHEAEKRHTEFPNTSMSVLGG